MEMSLSQILMKATDYKVCKQCNTVNWYENKQCIDCGEKDFDDDKLKVMDVVRKEYVYYRETENYTEKEIDDISVRV
jgi:ribosomal protein L40E